MPGEIVLQLSHKDVFLGFFKELKREVLSLKVIIAFANLLDNAADACHACEDKTISLTAAVNKGFLTIETENACRTQLQTKNAASRSWNAASDFQFFRSSPGSMTAASRTTPKTAGLQPV